MLGSFCHSSFPSTFIGFLIISLASHALCHSVQNVGMKQGYVHWLCSGGFKACRFEVSLPFCRNVSKEPMYGHFLLH